MGQPVAGNPTQYMMQKAFQRADLDWCYLTFEVPPNCLEDAMRGFRAFEFRGGNITIPHNRTAVEYVDELTDAARHCGAINCVTRVEDRLEGDNTIGRSFMQSLRDMTDPVSKRIVLLGAGSVARAIGMELALAGAGPITVVNRTEPHGRELVDLLQQNTQAEVVYDLWEGNYRVNAATAVLIHATSIGRDNPDIPVPVDLESLQPECVVADVVPSPLPSAFLETAVKHGCRTISGLDMLVNQGILAFQRWTGISPDALVMREAVEEFLSI
ncbi:MAG: shikimate dehydrogenase [Pirellulales bacterium]|nr:shikimate dehydrogenase [Pirellulales bacterium]